MFRARRFIPGVVFIFAFAWLSACERVALMPRPDIDREGRPIDHQRTDRDRGDLDHGDVDNHLDRNSANAHDVIGTIERVNRADNEIQLRTTEGRVMVVKYDPATMVYDRDREIGIDGLRPRDQVLVKVSTNSRGQDYTDTVRLNDSRTSGGRGY